MRSPPAQDWEFGRERDEEHRLHPDLVCWEELPEEQRQVDREHVAAIPDLLAALNRAVALSPISPSAHATRFP